MARPRHYNTEQELQEAVDIYFAEIKEDKDAKPTITGLALSLGFCSRSTFYEYEQNGEFSDTIKRARLRVENVYESNLHSGNATGSIFALKNFGWKDKTELEHSGKEGSPIEITDTQRAARLAAILERGREERDRQSDK
jgi:cell division protein FtsI/penicillin-binding protein 2